MKKVIASILLLLLMAGCRRKASPADLEQFSKDALPLWNRKLTAVMMGDVFSPPVCSRIYAYTNIAAYETLLHGMDSSEYISFAGKLNGLTATPKPENSKQYNFPIASIFAFTTAAEKMVFNGKAIQDLQAAYINQLDSIGIDKTLLENSVAYGKIVGQHILAWAAKDGYLQRTSFGGYNVTKEDGRWVPTPPDYMDATENNWNTVRPLLLDSASAYRPGPPPAYDTTKGSPFYQQALEVFKEIKEPNQSDSAIAWYWDDNPNTSITDGHITYFLQKVSPPGHWVYIASSVAEKEDFDAIKTAALISRTAIALYDGFIACWEAKFHYNYVRPETVINRWIEKDWQPLIQTPPFPEYPGGHGCISASAAQVLTSMVGDNYHFTDSTEVPFGRPQRTYNSFYEAAAQANISRFYGGIHFLNSLKVGAALGKEVGANVVQKFK